MRALILEDDARLRSLVVRTLSRTGLACDEASTIEEADDLMDLHAYDLLVLDRRLPDGDGLDVCRRARSKGFGQSVLMLTAWTTPQRPSKGSPRGPTTTWASRLILTCSQPERARCCGATNDRPTQELASGDLRLDAMRRAAWKGAAPLVLTAREFAILETLLRRAGAVVSREEILEQAWGEREEPMSNTIDVLIARLRRKIDDPGKPSRIETLRGMGYRLR